KITSADAEWSELAVWVGDTKTGHMVSLASLGITELDLTSTASQQTQNGNLIGLVGSYETADGASHEMADIWFAQSASASSSTSATSHASVLPQVSDLLQGPSGSVLEGSHASSSTADAHVAGGAGLLSRSLLHPDDEPGLRSHVLI
ncbi:MAG: hypothetical protein JO369_08540, partial [Paucibacter sp.]|nr:hypothetical protein [Roseateles sp.]